MKNNIQQLNISNITSDVFVIAPSQIDYVAKLFADTVAEKMQLHAFSDKFRQIADESLRMALMAAKTQGKK